MFQLPRGVDINSSVGQFPGLLYTKDLNGRYIGCNNEFLEFMSTCRFIKAPSFDEIIQRTDFDFFPSDQAKVLTENDQSVIQTGESKLFEELVMDADGQFYTHISNKSPFRDRSGEILGVVCTSVSISEKSRQIQQARKSMVNFAQMQQANLYREKILWNLPERFYWKDIESRVVSCNELQAQSFGLTREQFIGMNISDLAEHMGWSEEIADQLRNNDLRVLETREPIIIEEHIRDVKGIPQVVLSYKYPLFGAQGELIGLFGISIDITERKAMEEKLNRQRQEAELASRAKTEFLMNISHDLRTPFSGIIGNAELLLYQEADSSKRQMLQQIIDSSCSLLDLLNDIIDVVKLDEHNQPRMVPVDLRQSIEKIVTIMKIEADQKHLGLNVIIPDHLPSRVITDSRYVERILLNLLGNALKFTHVGKIDVVVDCIECSSERVALSISVHDTGIGIAKDKLDTVFDQFTRLTHSFKRNYEGSGLGLWIVRQLVSQLGGQIKIDSVEGQGTRMTFELECDIEDAPPMAKMLEDILPLMSIVNGRVLVVEDEPIARKIAANLMSRYFNATVDEVSCAAEALVLVAKQSFDLILMDIGLPDLDGVRVAENIKHQEGPNQYTPIIALTAHANMAFDHAIITHVLDKPLTYEKCRKIAKALCS